jgi:ABC-type transport system involved in cytochrome c biogenesis permease component
MNGLFFQLVVSLRLHFRNRMAVIYSYLFPTIFLLAFWVLYRYETPPLVRHMGELLTVTILGGACFGLPTTLVSDRERGVWRRYRLTPVPTFNIVASTVVARYLLLLMAGLLQLVLAMLIGMPFPRHPADLFVAFSLVSFAFVGLGLVIATMADNVPAVQALGQCIFLPMLIIGGVAVPLESLPDWAQHVSAFFPGRYAVEALRASVMGDGLGAARFSLLALLLIGTAGCMSGARLFRWDSQQRFAAIAGKAWVAVALVAWAAVGIAAETRHRTIVRSTMAGSQPAPPPAVSQPVATSETPTPTASAAPAATPVEGGKSQPATAAPATPPSAATPTRGLQPPTLSAAERATPRTAPADIPARPKAASSPAASSEAPLPAPAKPSGPASPGDWQKTTIEDIDREIDFTRLPPDSGVVTPIARDDEEPEPEVAQQLATLHTRLPDWGPGKVEDPVQRARNLLYVAAVPDVLQTPIERFAPLEIYESLQQSIPKPQLIQALFWIALHPMDGDDSAIEQLSVLGTNYPPTDIEEARNRAAFYAVKLLGRLTGKIVPK